MSRRPGAVDRHALLSSGAYPSSSYRYQNGSSGEFQAASSSATSTHGGGVGGGGGGGGGLDAYRNVSPFEQPHGSHPSNPYAEYGAPKKELPMPSAYANRSSGTGGIGSLFGLRTAEQLEEQNDEHLEGLSAKVRVLRDITVGIGNEVRDSTKDLNSLSEAFSNTSAFLGNTFTRMNHMARRQGGWFCNMMMFLIFVIWLFILLWWWRR